MFQSTRTVIDESVLQGLAEVIERDRVGGGEVGDRSRHANHPMKRAGGQDKGKGESTNCHFTGNHRFVDIHVALVEDFDDLESEALVVEPTPRFYAKHSKWVWGRLLDLEGSKDPVRISGWTLYDPSHGPHIGKYRKSMWEIHPITKIEIFRNGKWVEW